MEKFTFKKTHNRIITTILLLVMLMPYTVRAEESDTPTYDCLPLTYISSNNSSIEEVYPQYTPDKLIDGNTESSWYCGVDEWTNPEIIFQTETPTVLKAYSLTEGQDAADNPGLNWTSWEIYGTNDNLDNDPWWTRLTYISWVDIRKNEDSYNQITKGFSTEGNDVAYKYYKVIIRGVKNGNRQMMAELKFYGVQIPEAVETMCETGHTWTETNICSVCGIKRYICDGPVYEGKAYDELGGIYPIKLEFKDVTNHSFMLNVTIEDNIGEKQEMIDYGEWVLLHMDLPGRPDWQPSVAVPWGVTRQFYIDNISPGTVYQIEEIRAIINPLDSRDHQLTARIFTIPSVTILEGDFLPCVNGHWLNAQGECIACHIHKTHEHTYVDGICSQCGDRQQSRMSFNVVRAVPSASTNETGAYALDGITDSKWCGEISNGHPYMLLRHNCRASISRYNLITGNDIHFENSSGNNNAEEISRNPKEWKLYAKENAGDPWTVISHVTDAKLPTTNSTQSRDYEIDRAYMGKYFKFFKFEIIDIENHDIKKSKIFEVAEINLIGNAHYSHDFDDNDVCTNCGEERIHQHNFENGICTKCEEYEPVSGEGTETSPYLIGNAGQLAWYRDETRNCRRSICAKLTADIDMSAVCNENIGGWMGIYSEGAVFDGDGHVLKNLYVNDEYTYAGLFHISTGVIKNLGIESGYVTSSNYGLAAICAYNSGKISSYEKNGKIINCFNKATVVSTCNKTDDSTVGGICGVNDNGSIENCYNTGYVSSSMKGGRIGGICGVILGNTLRSPVPNIKNCYNTGSTTQIIEDSYRIGSIIGYDSRSSTEVGLIANNYYLEGNCPDGHATAMTAEQFASGEVTWRLNGSTDTDGNWTAGATDGSQAWYQKLGTDALPMLTADKDNTVYSYINCKEESSYTNDADKKDGDHDMVIYAKADHDGLYPYHCTLCLEFFDDHKVLRELYEGCEDIEMNKDGSFWKTDADISLPDGKEYKSPVTFFASKATYTRQMNNEWSTICLPFGITTDDNENYLLYEFDTDNTQSEGVLILKKTNTLEAGKAMLVYAKQGTAIDIQQDNALFESRSYLDRLQSTAIHHYGGHMLYAKGTLAVQSLGDKNGYMLYGNKFWSISELMKQNRVNDVKIAPYRAWIETDSYNESKSINFIINDETTTIDAVNALVGGNVEYYDINGRRTSSLQNGLNIVKGKDGKVHKIIVK